MKADDGGIDGGKEEQTPFERFEALTRGLLSVPKSRIDEKLAEEKAEKARAAKAHKQPKGQ